MTDQSSYANLIRLYDCPRLNEKYKGIVALPLALPKFELDDTEQFWNIWNKEKAIVDRQHIDRGAEGKIGDVLMTHQQWEGLSMFDIPSLRSAGAWGTKLSTELVESQPKYLKSIFELLPFNKIRSVRFWSNSITIPAHYDGNMPASLDGQMRFPTEIRLMLYNENPKETFYLASATKHTAHTDIPEEDRFYVKLPNDTNSFAWNNEDYLHGADYDPRYKKILVVVKGWVHLGRLEKLLDESISKYSEYVIRKNHDN